MPRPRRWLLPGLLLGAVAALVVGLTVPFDRKPADETGRVPTVRFTDVTESAGIRFRHVNGAAGKKLLPETMGGGVAVIDYDGDGRPDLFFVNSRPWPGHPGRSTPALY